jgi:pyroglutamyl-peptidase
MKEGRSQAKTGNMLKTSTSLSNMSCLVTGFDPFNDFYHNPSASIAMALPSYLHLKKQNLQVSINSMVLPTEGKQAWKLLKSAIDELPSTEPAIILMLGQAANRKVISLERFALNFRDYRIKDNAGRMHVAQTIDKTAPEALRTVAPIEEVLAYCLGKGVPIDASNHAGTFVCNEVYFQVLQYIRRLKLPHMVYFVHVPLPRIYGKALEKAKLARWSKFASGKENQLAAMVEATKLIIEFSAEFISKK